MANKVKLKTLVEKMNLKNLTPDVDLSEKEVEIPDINRPALQLTGFFEHFDSERVQIIGYVEYTFLEKMTDEVKKKKIYETLLSYKIPCLIFCRNLPPETMLLEMAEKANIPVFQTEKKTSEFTAEIIRWLNVELAPSVLLQEPQVPHPDWRTGFLFLQQKAQHRPSPLPQNRLQSLQTNRTLLLQFLQLMPESLLQAVSQSEIRSLQLL